MKRLFIFALCLVFAGICFAQSYVPTSTAATSSGSVTIGYCQVTFVTSSDWSGTINGAAFPASQRLVVGFPNNNGKTLAAIPYTRSAGTLYITATTCR